MGDVGGVGAPWVGLTCSGTICPRRVRGTPDPRRLFPLPRPSPGRAGDGERVVGRGEGAGRVLQGASRDCTTPLPRTSGEGSTCLAGGESPHPPSSPPYPNPFLPLEGRNRRLVPPPWTPVAGGGKWVSSPPPKSPPPHRIVRVRGPYSPLSFARPSLSVRPPSPSKNLTCPILSR